jgi:hypothetical protein
MNFDKLRGKIAERNITYAKCADAINTSTTTFSKKMNQQGEFSVSDINQLANFLELSQQEKLDIFLSTNLHTMQE